MYKTKDGRFAEHIRTIDGKSKVFYSRQTDEKKAAKEIKQKILEFKYNETAAPAFGIVAEKWIIEKAKSVSYNTLRRYNIYINTACRYFGQKNIKDISEKDINYMVSDLDLLDLSHKTIVETLAAVKQIFRFALYKEYIEKDITIFCKPKGGKEKVEREPLTEADEQKVKDFKTADIGLLPYFLLYTGLRRGEVLALQWKDIDFVNNLINVDKSVYYVSNKAELKTPKTKAGKRKVIMPNCLKDVLLPLAGSPNDFIFHDDDKQTPIRQSRFRQMWDKFRKAADLTQSAHCFRHSYATALFEADISEKDAQMLIGHSDITTTRNTYTHIREKHRAETAQKLNEFFNK